MLEDRRVVEHEVRRPDDRDSRCARLGRVRCQRLGVRSGLCPAVHDRRQRPAREEVGDAAALVEREQDPLAGRAEREDPGKAGVRVEPQERREGALVERGAAVTERGDGGRERTPDHWFRDRDPRPGQTYQR
jgi:hypothetical protein